MTAVVAMGMLTMVVVALMALLVPLVVAFWSLLVIGSTAIVMPPSVA